MQKRIAVMYSTTEGQTEKIARHIADYLRTHGVDVALMHAGEVPLDYTLENSDAVVLGASIHVGHHQDDITEYVKKHANELNEIPSAFFSVSLSANDDMEQAEEFVEEFSKKTGWKPDHGAAFRGALQYSKYNFIKRALMRSISEKHGGDTDTSKDYEYTDWSRVEAFAGRFLESL